MQRYLGSRPVMALPIQGITVGGTAVIIQNSQGLTTHIANKRQEYEMLKDAKVGQWLVVDEATKEVSVCNEEDFTRDYVELDPEQGECTLVPKVEIVAHEVTKVEANHNECGVLMGYFVYFKHGDVTYSPNNVHVGDYYVVLPGTNGVFMSAVVMNQLYRRI